MRVRNKTVAAAIAAGLLVTGCDQFLSGNGSTPAASETGPVEVPAEPEAPIASRFGAEITLTMECAALSTSEEFSREIVLAGGDGVYTYIRGEIDSARYELWTLELAEPDTFTIVGEYIEGTPNVKPIEFSGTVDGLALSGQGSRGPRACTVRS